MLNGKVYDVIVDLRMGSETFGRWLGYELSAENAMALYVPKGFAHGFASLENGTVTLYQCDGKYDKESDTGIRFDDREIDIKWPIDKKQAVLSSRDLQLGSLEQYQKHPMEREDD